MYGVGVPVAGTMTALVRIPPESTKIDTVYPPASTTSAISRSVEAVTLSTLTVKLSVGAVPPTAVPRTVNWSAS